MHQGTDSFELAGSVFSRKNPLIIAELGTAHASSIAKALELIHAAAESGAGCVKFQHVYADEIIHPKTGLVPLPGGAIPLYERFRQLETSPAFFVQAKAACERLGLIFLCTPFGQRSARELLALGVSALKIASPELNDEALVGFAARSGLPTLLSTGVSRLADIECALQGFARGQAALLHCVTAYPAPPEDYNLRLLGNLSAIFGVPCGVSDHSMDPEIVPGLAVALGSFIVEKHICLSRDDEGLDDPIALPPADFARMARAIRLAAADPEGCVADLRARFGDECVDRTLGDGVKRLAPSESANYERTNRTLHAARAIRAGEKFTEDNVAALRTEKVLRPGLPPRFLREILGRAAAQDVPDGEGIRWEDVGAP